MEQTTQTTQNAPPPATGQPNGAGAPPPSTNNTTPDWTTGLTDEMKGYVQNKGFKSVPDVLDSYRNFEKLHGVPQDQLLRLPQDMTSPEGRAVWERLGAPKEAKAYELQPKEGDKSFGEWAEKTFFDANVPKGMAKKIADAFDNYQKESMTKAEAQAKALQTQAQQELKTKWGEAFEQNKNMVDQGAIALGLDQQAVAALAHAMGPVKAAELLLTLATATGEHDFHAGNGPSGNRVLTPDSAKSKIEELMTNRDFVERLNKGDVAARKEWDLAHQMAYPGMSNL